MKKVMFGLMACATLLVVSCEPNNSAEDEQLYEQGVDKTKVVKPGDREPQSVDKTKVVKPGDRDPQSVDKTKVVKPGDRDPQSVDKTKVIKPGDRK